MANGKTHAIVSIVAAVPSGVLGLSMGSPLLAVAMASGAILGTILSPDLDLLEQPGKCLPEQIMGKIPIIGFMFYLYWLPYGVAIPHRHSIGHLPFVGTLLRFSYALLPPLIALVILLYQGYIPPEQVKAIPFDIPLGLFLGLLVSDTLHWLFDGAPI